MLSHISRASRQYKLYYLWFGAILVALMEYLFAFQTNILIDDGLRLIDEGHLTNIIVKIVALCLFLMISKYLINFYTLKIEKINQQNMTLSLLIKTQSINLKQIIPDSGKWYSILTDDIDTVSRVIVRVSTALVAGSLSFIVATLYGFIHTPLYMVIIILLSFSSVFVPKYLTGILIESREKQQVGLDTIQQIIIQLFDNEIIFRAMKATTFATDLFNRNYVHYTKAIYQHKKNMHKLTSASVLIGLLFDVIKLGLGVYFISINYMTLGDFLAISVLNNSIMWLFNDMPYLYNELLNAKVSIRRIDSINCSDAFKYPSIVSLKNINNVRWEGVTHKYFDRIVFENINLSINISKSEKIVISGKSGSGKSTLLKCLSGEIDHNGKIYINNNEVKNKLPNISLVPQSIKMFSGTIKENLLFNLSEKNSNLLKQDSDLQYLNAQIDELISKYRRENVKNNLSSGQKQKVALIRALLKKEAILLLDEPIANVDIESEIEIINSLKLINRPMIIVSHRLNEFDSEFTKYNLEEGQLLRVSR